MLREPREDPFGKSNIDDENTVDNNGATTTRANHIESPRITGGKNTVDNNGTTATRANECIESQRPIGDKYVANNNGAAATRANECIKSPRSIDGKDIVDSSGQHDTCRMFSKTKTPPTSSKVTPALRCGGCPAAPRVHGTY